MKVTSLRYLDAKFHHPSLGASPPNRGKTFACLQNSVADKQATPSAEIEQNKCVGVAIATFDVWKRTMDRNNQSG